MNKLIQGDCLMYLEQCKPVTCIFADPPDNIGLGYDEYEDNKTISDYEAWLFMLLRSCLRKSKIVWFSFNAKWTMAMGSFAQTLKLIPQFQDVVVKPCVQVFTFGQHNDHDLGNNHRPLWRLMKKDAVLYPESIRVPSWRQRNGDKRASPKGRVPGDVLDMQYASDESKRQKEQCKRRYDELQAALKATTPEAIEKAKALMLETRQLFSTHLHSGDVFDFPRVTGNSKQRCDWHPTQLHEDMVERCVKLSTKEGDTVLDPFGGTGTTLRVCERINRDCTLVELDKGYCEKIAEENNLTQQRPGVWSNEGRVVEKRVA